MDNAGEGQAPSAGVRRALPGGVVTFLMTDVVGSTRLWEQDARTMREALIRHDELMGEVVGAHRGVVLRERGEGDSTFSVFWRATDGGAAAIAAQLAFRREPWPATCPIQVRMAVHTGEASERDGDYYGRAVNRVARLRAIAEGGQILVSKSTAEILLDHLPEDTTLTELGLRELKDMDRPEMVYVLTVPEMAADATPALPRRERAGPRPDGAREDALSAPPRGWQLVVSVDPNGPSARRHQGTGSSQRRAVAMGLAQRPAEATGPSPRPVEATFVLSRDRVLIGRHSTTLGVSPDIDLSGDLDDPGVSRVHAILERQPDGSYSLIDPGSTNGTFLNDAAEPVPPSQPINLRAGDRIVIGAWTCIQISPVA
jgi:class 3 adenylate cyclase